MGDRDPTPAGARGKVAPDSTTSSAELDVEAFKPPAGEDHPDVKPQIQRGTLPALCAAAWRAVTAYVLKMRGGIGHPPPASSLTEVTQAGFGSLVGLIAVAGLNHALVGNVTLPLLLGCFGASCTLLFGMPHLPPAQPRNVVGGMVLSCIVGVVIRTLLGTIVVIAAPIAVALAVVAMQMTATIHPPGGAAALIIAVMLPLTSVDPLIIASTELHTSQNANWCIRDNLERDMGQRFLHGLELALATMLGTAVLLAIAVITNNLGPKRYPIYWWK